MLCSFRHVLPAVSKTVVCGKCNGAITPRMAYRPAARHQKHFPDGPLNDDAGFTRDACPTTNPRANVTNADGVRGTPPAPQLSAKSARYCGGDGISWSMGSPTLVESAQLFDNVPVCRDNRTPRFHCQRAVTDSSSAGPFRDGIPPLDRLQRNDPSLTADTHFTSGPLIPDVSCAYVISQSVVGETGAGGYPTEHRTTVEEGDLVAELGIDLAMATKPV